MTVQWANRLVKEAEGLDPHTLQKAEFYVRQIANAISPSNFVLTNPELLRETVTSNAENLVRGMHMLAEDIEAGHGNLKIRQSDARMFEVGRNLALTAGKVIFENELMQLIQYAPSTGTVLKRPLLIVPPWINKFYILDLTPEKSFVKWCVDQGLTVFVISWVNPDANLAKKGFEDYMRDGPLAALDVIEKATGEREVNAIGYCVGGTLLGHHARLYGQHARCAHRLGDVLRRAGRFHPCRRPQGVRRRGADRGARARNERARLSRRQEDGKRLQPAALERSDLALRDQQLPQRQGTRPIRPALLELGRNADAGGEPLVLSAQLLSGEPAEQERDGDRRQAARPQEGITVPIYNLATREDHIAPAKSVLLGSKFFGGPVRFVLAGSGHIAGVVNPPDKMKYQYWTGPKPTSANLDRWLGKAKEHAGSWWPDWFDWIKKQDASEVAAREPGGGALKPIEDAPGSYVKVRD